jgi:hypothetical protein
MTVELSSLWGGIGVVLLMVSGVGLDCLPDVWWECSDGYGLVLIGAYGVLRHLPYSHC